MTPFNALQSALSVEGLKYTLLHDGALLEHGSKSGQMLIHMPLPMI